MFLRIAALASVLALALVSHGWTQDSHHDPPSSQPSGSGSSGGAPPMLGGSSIDEYVARTLEGRKHGFIYIDAVASSTRSCSNVTITIARNVEGQWRQGAIPAARTFFGVQAANGGMAALEPGEYLVTQVNCVNYGSRVYMIGPFARFHVNAGEVVNVGMLTLVRGRDASGKEAVIGRSVSGMRPEARALMRERAPKTVARMVERHMTPVTPTAASRAPAPGNAVSPTIAGETRY